MNADFDAEEFEAQVTRYSGFSEADKLQADELLARLNKEAGVLSDEALAAFKDYRASEESGNFSHDELMSKIERSGVLAEQSMKAGEAAKTAQEQSLEITNKRQQARERICAQKDAFRAAFTQCAGRLNS